MMLRRLILRFVALLGWWMAGWAWAGPPVTVFAAASLGGALDEAIGLHETPVAISYGGSGMLARQVVAGAPADLVILANVRWMDWLAQQGAVPARPVILLSNQLVLIGPAGAPSLASPNAETLVARLGSGRLAMGQRDAVPAGIYARDWLRRIGAWPDLQSRLAETENVRLALAFVARGEAPLGLVYASDAQADPRVDVVYAIPPGGHAPILYPAVALSPAGERVLETLQSPEAKEIFAARGFLPPP